MSETDIQNQNVDFETRKQNVDQRLEQNLVILT